MLTRTLPLTAAADRADVLARIERALGLVNARLGLSFAHDGAEDHEGVRYTVWTDDPAGSTETSWVRLSDDAQAGWLCLEVNATTEAVLETLCGELSSQVPSLTSIATR